MLLGWDLDVLGFSGACFPGPIDNLYILEGKTGFQIEGILGFSRDMEPIR